ncbi:hypothetical protein ACJ41O_013848 [Fusarium nematophilum]
MAEAVGLAASVIAIIELSAKVSALCLDYSTAVSNARADITRLKTRVDDLGTTFRRLQVLLGGLNTQALPTSRDLLDSLCSCTAELTQVQSRLDPDKTGKAMRRFGLRALKWPLDSKEVSDVLSRLERYEQIITLGLQIDQTTLLLGIVQKFGGISIQPEEDVSIARRPYFSVPFERDCLPPHLKPIKAITSIDRTAIEPISFAIGVIELTGLFSSCLEAVDKVQTDRSFGSDSHVLDARFKAAKNWLNQEFPAGAKLLWINGPAGFGKTILCAHVVEHLSSTLETPVAYFFFSSDLESREDPFVAVRSWVSQVVSQHEGAFEHVR